jgi:cardiolipin synthase (CMP-forming)
MNQPSFISQTASKSWNSRWSKCLTLNHQRNILLAPARFQSRQSSTTSGSQPSTPPTTPKATTTAPVSLASLPKTRHENIYTIPNILTFSRLGAAPLVGYFILTSQPLYALALFFYAGVTDLIDGYLARRFNQQTVVGTVIDPMADKFLMTICVAALGYTGVFPWWLVTIILGRDVALAISAIWWRWISLPPPKTFLRYWDFSLPSAEVHPTEISKINTLLQLLVVGNAMVLPVLPLGLVEAGNLAGILEGWEYLVAGTTLWSGLSYVGNKTAVRVLTQEEREQKMEEMGVKTPKDSTGDQQQ